jgi:hypothetical protein
MKSDKTAIPLWERVRRAAHATEWLSLTHDVAPAVGVAIVTIVVTWAIAPAKPKFGWQATSLPLLAGVAALAVTYLLVNLIEFIVNCGRANTEWRLDNERQKQAILEISADDQVILSWTKNKLGKIELGVAFAAAFGSITAHYSARDVDIVVQLMSSSDRTATRRAAELKKLNGAFMAEFQLPLHLQLFLSTETRGLFDFARKAGKLTILIGEKHWEEISGPLSFPFSASE